MMADVRMAPTERLTDAFLHELRGFLDVAFPGDFSEDDWAHSLGGVHAWIRGPEGLICHGSLVERSLGFSSGRLRVGYVEAVATLAARRREGHATSVMRRIGDLIRERYPLGALSSSTHAFYETLGWEHWRGKTFVDGPDGYESTPQDDGDIMILRTPRSPDLDLDSDIVCDWRSGDVW
jgi:aminoglycoside 2'-N-acetyltransferase I